MLCKGRCYSARTKRPACICLPDIFAEFQRRFPQVHISIYRNFSHKILQRIEDGSDDVGIVTLPTKSPNLRVHHIHKDRLRFMVSTRNPLAHRTKITLEEVAAQPLIFPKTGFTRQVLDKLFRPYRSRIRISMELPSVGMIKRFVAADAGVSFISESFAKRLRQGRGSEVAYGRGRRSSGANLGWSTGAIAVCRARRRR